MLVTPIFLTVDDDPARRGNRKEKNSYFLNPFHPEGKYNKDVIKRDGGARNLE